LGKIILDFWSMFWNRECFTGSGGKWNGKWYQFKV